MDERAGPRFRDIFPLDRGNQRTTYTQPRPNSAKIIIVLHLQRGDPAHVFECPLVDLANVVVAEVDGLEGVEAAEAVTRQVSHQVVTHVEIPETKLIIIMNFGLNPKRERKLYFKSFHQVPTLAAHVLNGKPVGLGDTFGACFCVH